ncbi:MAG: tetratricopeptide repeat protein [Deltaproteobacteria bacterium]|nr:tetratricopeptide repeat protein [Deltaproteobacteria bacterium]
MDDKSFIENNSCIKDNQSFASYFIQEDGATETWEGNIEHTGYYRPLINLTYRIDYMLWGVNAQGFRTSNVIFHILSCLFLYNIILLLVNDRKAALLATVLFALHPVNTESVSWIVARNNILVTLTVLSSLYFFIRGWEKNEVFPIALSVLCFALAVLSKEFGLMILPVFVLYQTMVSKRKGTFLEKMGIYVPYLAVVIIYFILRKNVTTLLLPPFDMNDLLARIYYVPYIILYNLQIILFPRGLHSLIVPYPSSFLEWQPLLSIGAVSLLGIVLWLQRKQRILVFSVLAFLIVIIPVLNVIPTKAVTLISMRWLYLPMAFIMVGVALIIKKVRERREGLAIAVLCAVILYFGVYSHILNRSLWHDEETFFNQEVVNFENYFYADGLAELLFDKKNYNAAEKYYLIKMDTYPRHHEASIHVGYSSLLIGSGRIEEAEFYLDRSRSLKMSQAEKGEWLNNMGVVLTSKGTYEGGIEHFLKALEINPEYAEAYNNLGVALASLGRTDEAVESFKKALTFRPDYREARNNLRVLTGQ